MIHAVFLDSIGLALFSLAWWGWLIGGGLAVVGMLFGVHVAVGAPAAEASSSDYQEEIADALNRGDVSAAASYVQQSQPGYSGPASDPFQKTYEEQLHEDVRQGHKSMADLQAYEQQKWLNTPMAGPETRPLTQQEIAERDAAKAAEDAEWAAYQAEWAQYERDLAAWKAQQGSGGGGGAPAAPSSSSSDLLSSMQSAANSHYYVSDAYFAAHEVYMQAYGEGRATQDAYNWLQSLSERSSNEGLFGVYNSDAKTPADTARATGAASPAMAAFLEDSASRDAQFQADANRVAVVKWKAKKTQVEADWSAGAEGGEVDVAMKTKARKGSTVKIQVMEYNADKGRMVVVDTTKAKVGKGGKIHTAVEADAGDVIMVKKNTGKKLAQIEIPGQ